MKRQVMLIHLVFFTTGMLLVANATADNYTDPVAWRGGDCFANCVSLYRHDDRLLVIGRDAAGRIVATGSAAVGADARGQFPGGRASVSESPPPAPGADLQSSMPGTGTCLGTTGTCVDQSVLRFETATHLIIVTVTYFFFDGELHDIDVREKRFAKNKIK